MKKISLILAFVLMLLSTAANAADTNTNGNSDYITDKGDEYITVLRKEDWTPGEMTTFAIANVSGMQNSGADLTWDEITDMALTNSDIITFYDTGTVSQNIKYKNGECEFNLILENSGVYKCFLVDENGNSDIFYINHINETNQKNAADSIINACADVEQTAIDDIKNILSTNAMDFGLADDLYSNIKAGTENNEGNVAKYIYDFVKSDKFDKTSENSTEVLCGAVLRAVAAESLNMGITQNLYDIEYAMGIDSLGLDNYVKKSHSDILNAKMTAKKYSSIDEYDKALIETFTGLSIQYNDGADEIPSILKKYAYLSGINTQKITTAFCESIAGKDNFYSFKALNDYADGFIEPNPPSGSSGSSGSSSSGSRKDALVVDSSFVTNNVDKNTDISIFDDVPKEHWANEYIESLFKKGIVSGVSANEYSPDANVTREEFVKLLVLALELNTTGDNAPFKDVDQNDWYAKYVNVAFNSDVINGISDEEFGTGMNIIRQDIAVMVANALKVIDYQFADGGELTFSDSEGIDSYAVDAVRLLKNAGILNGDENNRFNPKENASRAEAAKIIYMISRK